jgi:hypothetical protein
LYRVIGHEQGVKAKAAPGKQRQVRCELGQDIQEAEEEKEIGIPWLFLVGSQDLCVSHGFGKNSLAFAQIFCAYPMAFCRYPMAFMRIPWLFMRIPWLLAKLAGENAVLSLPLKAR